MSSGEIDEPTYSEWFSGGGERVDDSIRIEENDVSRLQLQSRGVWRHSFQPEGKHGLNRFRLAGGMVSDEKRERMTDVDPVKLACSQIQGADVAGDEGLSSSLKKDGPVDLSGKFLQRTTATPAQAIGPHGEGGKHCCAEAVSHGVKHGEIQPAVVRREVEGIARDVVCGFQSARDVHAGIRIRREGEQIPLHHRGERKLAGPPGYLEDVAVPSCTDDGSPDESSERGGIEGYAFPVRLHTQAEDPDAVAALVNGNPKNGTVLSVALRLDRAPGEKGATGYGSPDADGVWRRWIEPTRHGLQPLFCIVRHVEPQVSQLEWFGKHFVGHVQHGGGRRLIQSLKKRRKNRVRLDHSDVLVRGNLASYPLGGWPLSMNCARDGGR
jgi:hypothetical protein